MKRNTPPPEWLFIGTMPNCYVYCDKTRTTNGDFHLIARLYFHPLEIKVFDQSSKYAEAVKIATVNYQQIKDNIDLPIEVSATGQTIQPFLKVN